MTPEEQKDLIMDWIYGEGHPCFSIHDLDFLSCWHSMTGGVSEWALRRRLSDLVHEGRLDRRRQDDEAARPSGVPKWFYVYS